MPLTRRPRNRRRGSRSAAHYLLEVSAGSPSSRRRKRRTLLAWGFRLVFLAALGFAVYHGAAALFDRFFFSNPEYTLRRIDMELDEVMTREEALEATGLREGVNIFSIDLLAVGQALKSRAIVRDVRVERVLPDRLAVTVHAREGVAWVVPDGVVGVLPGDPPAGAWLADATGLLMRPLRVLPEHAKLPLITGLGEDLLREGVRPDSETFAAAVEILVELGRRPEILLRTRSMDLSRGFRVAVAADDGATYFFGLDDVPGQLARLQKLLAYCAASGRTIETANLMVRRNTPVTFVMAAAGPPPAPGGRKPASR